MINGKEELIYEERFMEYIVWFKQWPKRQHVQSGNGDNTSLHISVLTCKGKHTGIKYGKFINKRGNIRLNFKHC